jgi:dienelactone hydrolase
MKLVLAIILALGFTGAAEAKLVTKTVEYRQDGTVLKGYLAFDDVSRAKRPGVLVVHEYWGLNDHAKKRAEQLAALGYVALAGDMYGQGLTLSNPKDAGQHAAELRNNNPLLRARAQAALKVLAENPLVDPKKLAAIGFCFGGTTVLELAYSGTDLAGVVSFHGGLPLPKPGDAKPIKTPILVLHGADDPHVPAPEVAAFQEAMRQAGADWQLVLLGGAVHSFTNPAAGGDKAKGAAYDARSDKRSWRYMQDFFKELFGAKSRD